MDFESANPSVVKSIKQRDLLNTWLRLYAREQKMPRVAEYQPERLADELAELVYYTVDAAAQPPRLTIQSDGTRASHAYGHTGKGKYLDEYIGPRLVPVVMPVYYKCIAVGLPVYTIANIDDSYGRIVAYERLLLPFSEGTARRPRDRLAQDDQRGRRFRNQEPDAGKRCTADAETSHGDRSRSLPPRARPHFLRRPDRIRLALECNSKAQIPRLSDPSGSAISSTPGCAR